MSRLQRIEFENAIYHVTSRGNRKQNIVVDDKDRNVWLNQLGGIVEESGWILFAFALMDNHYHLFLKTPHANISCGMHKLNTSYSHYFNGRHYQVGHVFHNRFKAIIVQEEGHYLVLSRYIHLNPVKAHIVDVPDDWRWSSYNGYIDVSKRISWMNYEAVLREFGGDNHGGRESYKKSVIDHLGNLDDSPFKGMKHGSILGSPDFIKGLGAVVGDKLDKRFLIGSDDLLDKEMTIIENTVLDYLGGNAQQWKNGKRCNDASRAIVAYLASKNGKISKTFIAQRLGFKSRSGVTEACRRVSEKMKDDEFVAKIRQIESALLNI